VPEVALDLRETAHRLAGYVRVESRGSEVVGSWVGAVPDAAAKVLLAGHAAHLAWRARLWRELLPQLWDVERAEPWGPGAAASPPGGALAALAVVTDRPGGDPTVDALVALHRFLLPRLLAAYADHLARTTEAADGPVARVLQLVSADAEADRRAGQALLEARLAHPAPGAEGAGARADALLADLAARPAAADGLPS
jgi:hypothetical protein